MLAKPELTPILGSSFLMNTALIDHWLFQKCGLSLWNSNFQRIFWRKLFALQRVFRSFYNISSLHVFFPLVQSQLDVCPKAPREMLPHLHAHALEITTHFPFPSLKQVCIQELETQASVGNNNIVLCLFLSNIIHQIGRFGNLILPVFFESLHFFISS